MPIVKSFYQMRIHFFRYMCVVHYFILTHSALSSAQKRRARLYNKEMTWLNLVNRASARLVDISTIINHHHPMDPSGQKVCTS